MLLVCLFVGLTGAAAEAAEQSGDIQREALIASLERMIATGEPHHQTHDQGELLQRAVDRALTARDTEIELLATRAAALITARIGRPVITTTDTPPLSISARLALNLPRQVRYKADVSASFDGGEIVPLGSVESGKETFDLARALPPAARLPGAHHVRLRALVTFEALDGGAVPDPEYRDLPELAYAVYHAESDFAADARVFLFSPAGVSAQQFDTRLPDIPLAFWLNSVLVARGGDPIDEHNWRILFCDERTKEPPRQYRRLDLCSVFHFQLGTTLGQIWIRTGRVELTEDSVQWLAGAPAFEALRFYSDASESSELSHVENLLDTSPDQRPRPDASIAPEDIVITPNPKRANTATVSAIVRNKGDADLHSVYVEFIGGDFDNPSTIRHFLRDVPAGGDVKIEADISYPRGYGIVVIQLMPSLTEYSPWVMAAPEEPTRDDNVAFRAINPQRAAAGYVAAIEHRCRCRGY